MVRTTALGNVSASRWACDSGNNLSLVPHAISTGRSHCFIAFTAAMVWLGFRSAVNLAASRRTPAEVRKPPKMAGRCAASIPFRVTAEVNTFRPGPVVNPLSTIEPRV